MKKEGRVSRETFFDWIIDNVPIFEIIRLKIIRKLSKLKDNK